MKKNILIIIIALAIASLLTAVKITLTPLLMKDANYGISTLIKQGHVDDLFIGSSMFRQGIDTVSLENEERSTYLLAYNGHQPFSEYIQIKELLKNGINIDTLYVDMYAYSATAQVGLSDVRMIQDTSLKFTLSLYEQMREHGESGIGELYEMVVKANNEIFYTWPISYPLINSRYMNGGAVTKTEGKTEEYLSNLPLGFSEDAELNTEQTKALIDLIDLCKENNIDIVFVETPKYVRLYENNAYINIMKKYTSFLNECDCKIILSEKTVKECELTGVERYITYSFDNNDASYFSDLIHMSTDGRRQFANVLKEFMG